MYTWFQLSPWANTCFFVVVGFLGCFFGGRGLIQDSVSCCKAHSHLWIRANRPENFTWVWIGFEPMFSRNNFGYTPNGIIIILIEKASDCWRELKMKKRSRKTYSPIDEEDRRDKKHNNGFDNKTVFVVNLLFVKYLKKTFCCRNRCVYLGFKQYFIHEIYQEYKKRYTENNNKQSL